MVTNEKEVSVSTDTVYAAAVVDGFIVQPSYLDSYLGDEYTYLYVVKVEDSGGATDFSYEAELTQKVTADAETAAEEA
ncbi:MAG: hypothetical protein LIO44_04570 [Eubacterium sp.]|nr:hypothetical protein [Eubacterium sp.]